MQILYLGSINRSVEKLQRLLVFGEYHVGVSGVFDRMTDEAVKQFQASQSIVVDGIVGPITWGKVFEVLYDGFFTKGIKDYQGFDAQQPEYFKEIIPKRSIYLHHTAGNYRPDYTIDWWTKDHSPGRLRRVGTAFVIGRKEPRTGGDASFDGLTYRAFNEKYWAHHLGLSNRDAGTSPGKNRRLNAGSIGIEICNFGPLGKDADGFFFQSGRYKYYVPEEEVCILDRPWRGYRYFQKYTDKQLLECKRLIFHLAYLFDIPIPSYAYSASWFDLKYDAFQDVPGIWTHCNVRFDKTDCFPQPALIELLNSLHADFQDFEPEFSERGPVKGAPARSLEEPAKNPERQAPYGEPLEEGRFREVVEELPSQEEEG